MTELQSPVQSLECNEENRLILNWISDITQLQNQGKHIILYTILAHLGINTNENAYKAVKVVQIPGMATTRLLYTNFYQKV